jgi:organic hydroperoxide reductase OsmC/OhrA
LLLVSKIRPICATISRKRWGKFDHGWTLMAEHHATIAWQRTSKDFTYATYNRDHEVRFQAVTVPGSSAPDYRGDPMRVNPEDMLVAALSSCHMLTFLAIATKRRVSLDSYTDEAIGYLEKNAEGRLALTRVILRPQVVWSAGITVAKTDLDKMHHEAHEGCFIANSVKTEVTVEPRN